MSENQKSIEEIKESLITTQKGTIVQCIQNVRTVLIEDPILKGKVKLNMHTDRCDIVGDIGWYRDSVSFNDADLAHLMFYLEKNYGLTVETKVKPALTVVGTENKYHPIQDKLNSLVWDGQERIKEVLHLFFGADRDNYTYEVMRIFLLGGISRVFNPGVKFEQMLILVGGQGVGKSTFFRLLAMNDSWFTDDLKNFSDDNVFRKLDGHWIIELSEMIATANAKSIEEIKAFLSRLSDNYKVPYDKFPKDHPRQCIIGGSSNNFDMLPADRTGNRRFLPVLCNEERAKRHILDDEVWSRAYLEQVWAEAMEIYKSGDFKLTLSTEATEYLKEYQGQFTPEDTDAGMIEDFLDNFTGNRICTKLLWHEALKRDYIPKKYELKDIGAILDHSTTIKGWRKTNKSMHFSAYGKQKAWVRIGSPDDKSNKMEVDVKPNKVEVDINGFCQLSLDEEVPFE